MQVTQIQNIAFETHLDCNGSLQARPNGKALLNAPLPGIIQSISCQNGQKVWGGQSLFEVGGTPLIDLQKDFAEAGEFYASYPVKSPIGGRVSGLQAIGSALNQASRAVDCYAALSGPLPEGAIADQFISATIVTQSDSMQALPSEAILQTEAGPVVLQLQRQDDEGYHFVPTPIKTGRQYKSHTEILDGPVQGQFLTAGLYNLVL